MKIICIENNQSASLAEIPVLPYGRFSETVLNLLSQPANHCVAYYAFPFNGKLKFICAVAQDEAHDIALCSHELNPGRKKSLPSLSARHLPLQMFEREIQENFGIDFDGHPWLKPVRFPHDRANAASVMDNYPFYSMESEELHEVGVGPIHAGVIEPGHFRFICHGEKILHLEIHLGYQHRGVEKLFLKKKTLLERTVLAESIAGDTAIGHTAAFAQVMEGLGGASLTPEIAWSRTLALELERIAVHTGDLSALCTDVAYQLGAAVLGALRTPVINFMQQWCGNRFGKGLIRVNGNSYPFTPALKEQLTRMLADYENRFQEMCEELFDRPSVLHRFEKTGSVTREQAELIGAVGMSARMAGLSRDVRASHPFLSFREIPYQPVILESGDVLARALLRRQEVIASLAFIRRLLNDGDAQALSGGRRPPTDIKLGAGQFCISLVEGWRGEICHAAVTGESGNLLHYKVVDPSFHNWLALALAVRNNGISDFPVCNKSFNLSYCGFDL